MNRKQLLLLAPSILAASFLIVSWPLIASGQETDTWLRRVLITNDDGIHEDRLRPIAEAFAAQIETWIVASTEDRSGSSNYTFLGKYHRSLTVQRVLKQKNLTAYAVAGFPADCVAFGVLGLLKDNPPDIVISGVNGGPNLGVDGWFGSGTLGAARTAAFLGIPAIAVSGLDDDDEEMMVKVSQWVVQLAGSPIAQNLKPGQYLTVAIPKISASEIRGIRIAPRMPSLLFAEMERVLYEEDDDETEEVWVIKSKGL